MKNFNLLIKTTLTLLCLSIFSFSYSQTTIGSYDFNSGRQGWTPTGGGSAVILSNNSCDGSQSIGTKKNFYAQSPNYGDLSSYSIITVSFCYTSTFCNNFEGFDFQYFDGTSWLTVESYRKPGGLPINTTYNISLSSCDYGGAFTSTNGAFRFQNVMSANSEVSYFDDVLIQGYSGGMAVSGNGTSIPDGNTAISTADDTSFGTIASGSTVTHTFTIDNQSGSTINLTGAPVTVSGSTEFIITSQPASAIASCTSTTFTVQFAPTSTGTFTSTINIGGIYTFNVEGFVTPADPEYTAVYESFDIDDGAWSPVTSIGDTWVWTNSFPAPASAIELSYEGMWRNSNYDDYSSNTNIVLESPSYDFSGLNNLLLSLSVKYETEAGQDGLRILYSISGGAYTLLGGSGQGEYWYEGNVPALATDGWSGESHIETKTWTFGKFIRASLNLSDGVFANQSDVKFRMQFISNGSGVDNGVAFDNFKIQADPIVALNDASIAPANLTSNLRLWLKANQGIAVANNAPLTSWEDQAFDTALDKEDADAKSTIAPTYRDNASRNINYNPVLDFDNTTTAYMNGKGGLFSQDLFVVVKSNDNVTNAIGSTARQFAIGARQVKDNDHDDPTGLGFGNTSGRYSNEAISFNIGSFSSGATAVPGPNSYGRAYVSSTTSFNHVMILNVKSDAARTVSEIYKNGKQIDNTTGTSGNGADLLFTELSNSQYLLGIANMSIAGRVPTAQLNGRLTEVISYKSPNSVLNKRKIQTYLGIKYGVTLQADGSALTDYRVNDVDYIDSDGNVIWDTSANTVHNYDVAGIGRDDASILDQRQSKSQNEEADGIGPTSGFLTMAQTDTYDTNNLNVANTTPLIDKAFLTWGNNNAALTDTAINVTVDLSENIVDPTNTLITDVSFTAIPRIWKVVENGGNVPSVEVSLPTNTIRVATPPDGRYLMFISSTGIFDPNAEYRVMTEVGGNLYADYDFDGTKYITFGWAPEEVFVRSVYFDPADNNYIDVEDNLDLNTTATGFTISAWIKRNTGTLNASIVSKRDAAASEGYDLKINNTGRLEFNYNGGAITLTSGAAIPIPENEWHQVAVIYNSGTATLYIDGVADTSAPGLAVPTPTTQSFLIAAAGKGTPQNFFYGNIDEVRVWDTALTEDQLHYIMNQEIEDNSNFVGGCYFISRSITPTKNDISPIPWAVLAGYYPMSTYVYTNTKDESYNSNQGALKNFKTVDWQTAPLPYISTANTNWNTNTTWLNGAMQPVPGTTSIVDNTKTVDWNIVKIDHNITLDNATLPSVNDGNRTVLGLFVDTNTLTVEGDNTAETGNGLSVTHYLHLDGKIDLQGESQLVQTLDSDLAVSSAGTLEKDQQGTQDLYTYNYWSSPVGVSNTTSNNNSYTVPQVLNDGTVANAPLAITFITNSSDGTSGTPIGIADYWIWKYANLEENYYNWLHIRSTGSILAGEGFTMKGVNDTGNVLTLQQNYMLEGKPHNGAITLPIDAGNDYLVGNPYASAIDSNLFILDNPNTTGVLYYWEHFGGGTHNTAGYQGGYATYNLSGGAPASQYDYATSTTDPFGGIGTKTPGRYIPVAQGFFVTGTTSGTINFNNNQRVFKEEGATSVFLKNNNNSSTFNPNSDVDDRLKIRLSLTTANTYKRQLLVTRDNNATDAIDFGYDAENTDGQSNDMFWMIDNRKFIIQGTNVIDASTILPLGIKTNISAINTFKIDALENVPVDLEIYIYDSVTGQYHDIKNNADFTINLPAGDYLDRFELRFNNGNSLSTEDFEVTGIQYYFANDNDAIVIQNPKLKNIEKIEVFNMLGQSIIMFDDIETKDYIELKTNNISNGNYILEIQTDDGKLSKKVLVE